MGATGTKVDRKSAVEAQALETVRQLLTELGGSRGLEELHARGLKAHLERELGLGSLERVELMLRLGAVCGVRLPEEAMAEANTVEDLVEAILRQEVVEAEAEAGASSRASIESAEAAPGSSAALAVRPELERQVQSAKSLTEILRLRGLGEPERAHIHLYEADEPRTITFGELYERASAAARELARRGLEPQQTVAIMLPTCAEFYASFAGVLLAGGIPVPIYPPFRADRIAEYAARQSNILRNAEARFLITWREAEGLARLLEPNVPSMREVLNGERLCAVSADAKTCAKTDTKAEAGSSPKRWRPVENLTHHARGENIAFLQYTSGSTGDPKGVVLTHANLLANIRSMIAGVEVVREDVAVSWLPLYHDMGLIGMWFAPLFAGIPIVVMSPVEFLTRPERWLWAIHRHGGTLSPAPNFAYELCVRKIAEKDIEGLDLSHWRAALNGAEPVHAATLEKFVARFERFGFRREAMLPVYGLAENSLAISTPKPGSGYRVDRIQRSTFESSGRAAAAESEAGANGDATLEFVGAGKPLADVGVRIVNGDGEEVGERVEGHLWFRGPSATSGYYRNESATRELMRGDGWLDSGDLAYWADGELFITGRAKDIIIKAGRNLYPHQIEAIAGKIAGVRPGCVVAFGVPDERQGTEKFVVTAEIRNAADAKRIESEIARAMQETMGLPPDVIELLPPQSIPKTSSGKLRRSETRRLYLEGKLGQKQQAQWMQIAELAVGGAAPRVWSVLRRGVENAAQFVYGVYALAVCGVVVPVLWILMAVTRDRERAARMIRTASRITLRYAFIRTRVEGEELLEKLPESGPWIFAPNHSSYLDIIVALALLPASVRFLVKADAVDIPFFGLMVRRSGQYLFDRNDPAARIRQADDVEAVLRRGESVVVYPEGTFTPVTGIRPFQLGAFKAALDAQRPICPVAMRSARQILRDNTYLPKFGRVTITVGPLVQPRPAGKDEWQEIVRLRDEVREIIARNAGEPML
jgi:fatty-acyl-CoA synthase